MTDPAFAPDAAALHDALDRLLDCFAAPSALPAPAYGDAGLPDALPEHGTGERAALERLAGPILRGAVPLRHPGFLAHMDPPTPWVTWAATQWAAALNQNLLHPDTAPVMRELEQRVVAWLAPAFGMTGGHLVPGSSVANLTALWAARELAGVREVVASDAAHISVRKAAHLLGLPFRAVPTDAAQRLVPAALGDVSQAGLVLTAGTVAAGAIDALGAGPDAAWRHVDAAWGGPLRLTATHAGLLDCIQHADSVAFSAHKWLWQPKESAAVLFADATRAHDALSFAGGYLAAPNVGVLGSHGSAALPLAATLLAWGRAGVAERLDTCMALADRLADLVHADPRLELRDRPQTGVVLWRPRHTDPDTVRRHLTDAFVSAATIDDQRWLRSVAANPMACPEHVVKRMLEAAALS